LANNIKIIVKNKKAHFNYQLNEQIEAGLILTGCEVKSLRMGKVNFVDSFAKIKNGEIWLIGCHITQYPYALYDNYNPERPRKLLMHKKEIIKLSSRVQGEGISLIPLSIYFKKAKAKIQLALAKGKKTYDKRYAIKKRELLREVERVLKY